MRVTNRPAIKRLGLWILFLLFGANAQEAGAGPIPEGSEIVVRTTQKIEGKKVMVGDRFRAVVDEDLTVEGQVVIRAGAGAELVVERGEEPASDLRLKLNSVYVDGQKYSMRTDFAQLRLEESGRETGKKTALGSGVGAIVGAIAGGGQGALIGAGVGAGTGLVISLLQEDRSVVPVETRLTFRLEKAVPVE